MKTIFTEVTVKMSTDDIEYVNELIRRDTPMLKTIASYNDGTGFKNVCGSCKGDVDAEAKYCPHCGQRQKTEV